MGFSENGCKRAAVAVGNSSAEAAMEWVFGHMEDANFHEPLPPPGVEQPPAGAGGGGGGGGGGGADPEAIAMLSGMGFTEHQAKGALAATSGNLERAADWPSPTRTTSTLPSRRRSARAAPRAAAAAAARARAAARGRRR